MLQFIFEEICLEEEAPIFLYKKKIIYKKDIRRHISLTNNTVYLNIILNSFLIKQLFLELL